MAKSDKWNVVYDDGDVSRIYCGMNMDLRTAKHMLANFKSLYLNEDGTGKIYPSGEGYYPFTNPRLVIM